VLDLIEIAARGLLRHILDNHPEIAADPAEDTTPRTGG